MKLTIPCGVCTECQRTIEVGETAEVVGLAGSAWRGDGFAVLEDGAEMFTARVLCSRCKAADVVDEVSV